MCTTSRKTNRSNLFVFKAKAQSKYCRCSKKLKAQCVLCGRMFWCWAHLIKGSSLTALTTWTNSLLFCAPLANCRSLVLLDYNCCLNHDPWIFSTFLSLIYFCSSHSGFYFLLEVNQLNSWSCYLKIEYNITTHLVLLILCNFLLKLLQLEWTKAPKKFFVID